MTLENTEPADRPDVLRPCVDQTVPDIDELVDYAGKSIAEQKVDFTHVGSPMQLVDIDLVEEGHRIRALNSDQVIALKESIVVVGLVNPITVYRCSITRTGEALDGFRLIAGAHRLGACRELGHTKIRVVILDMDELHRTIAECDENLYGTQLSSTERAEFTDRRKWAYEQLHPETVQHVAGGKARQGAASDNLSFAKATAASTGKNVRTVQRDAARAAKVGKDIRAMVKRTKLDKGVYLDELIGLSPTEQKQRVQADLEALEDGHRDAVATRGRAARKGNLGRKGSRGKARPHCPVPTADRPGCFAWHLEELAGYTRAEFTEWLSTERGCKDAIQRANAYAESAAAMIRHFQTTHPKAKA